MCTVAVFAVRSLHVANSTHGMLVKWKRRHVLNARMSSAEKAFRPNVTAVEVSSYFLF